MSLSNFLFFFVVFDLRTLGLHDLQLSEVATRLDLFEVRTTSGCQIWKISDFFRRRQDAISGRTVSLYSPPFFTSPAGYRVCARLYPNGDGIGKGTHLSLYFVVMRGEFDPLLKWPFAQKVSLILLDQNRVNPRDVVETFRPDPASTSFQRPESEMNVASGCPLFLPISTLERSSYMLGDTLYFKILVHTAGLQAPDGVSWRSSTALPLGAFGILTAVNSFERSPQYHTCLLAFSGCAVLSSIAIADAVQMSSYICVHAYTRSRFRVRGLLQTLLGGFFFLQFYLPTPLFLVSSQPKNSVPLIFYFN